MGAGGGEVLAGRPTDSNGTGLDASLETFLTNLEGGGVSRKGKERHH